MPEESLGRVRYRMLGTIEVVDGRGTIRTDLAARPKSLALLAYLALEARDGSCTRDSILALFWPDASTAGGRHALRQALYELRQALGPEVIETRGHATVCLSRDRFAADALELLDALEAGRVEDVVRLYRGDLLPGLHVAAAAPELEGWLDRTRDELRARVGEALWREGRRAEDEGDPARAVRWARLGVEHDPYDEDGLRRLMALLRTTGRSAEAIRAFRAFRARLASELEVPCSPETEALAAEIASAPKPNGTGPEPHELGAVSREPAGAADDDPVAPAVADAESVARARPREPWRIPSAGRRAASLIVGLVVLAAFGTGAAALLWSGSRETDADASVAAVPMNRPGTGSQLIASTREDAMAGPAVAAALSWLMGGRGGLAGVSVSGRIRPAQPSPAALAGEPGAWRVDVTLSRQDGEELHILSRVPGDLLSVVRFLADSIAASFDAEADDRLAMLPSSEAALRAHVRGEWLLERGEVYAAADAFQRAVSLDPAFALGHHRLALAAGLAFDAATAERAGQTALALQRQLPEVEARIVEARRAYRAGAAEEAEALLRSVLEMQPEHPEAVWDAAEVLFHFNPLRGRPAADALLPLRQAARQRVGRAESLYHIAQLSLLAGDLAGFDEASAALLEVAPGGNRNQQVRALRARLLETHDDWRRALAGLAGARDIVVLSAAHNLAVYAGDVPAALDVLEILTAVHREPGVRARAHAGRADLLTAAGRPAAVASELRRALALDHAIGSSRAAHLLTIGALPPGHPALRAVAEGIVASSPPAPRTTSAWISVEVALEPWLTEYTSAVAALALGDAGPATSLARELRAARPADRARQLLAADMTTRLRALDATDDWEYASLAIRGVTPEEATLSPIFSRPLARLSLGRLDRDLGRFRQGDRWFASLLEHSLPDLALAAVALGERARTAEMRGDAEGTHRFRARLAGLQADAEPEYLAWRAGQSWAPPGSADAGAR